jgi:ubiquitin carboxyl-terminal hydrolase 36/42
MEHCLQCGVVPPSGVILKCTKCKKASYCSRECQTIHWKGGHRGQCGLISETKNKIQFISMKNFQYTEPSLTLFPSERFDKLLNFNESFGIGAGLNNVANTCFLNSVLQCLCYTMPFRNYLLYSTHSQNCKRTNEKKFCPVCVLQEICENMFLGNYQYFTPKELLGKLKEIGEFQFGQQEDAQHFCIELLTKFHSVLFEESKKTLLADTPNLSKNELQKIEETTLIYQIFGGVLESDIQCLSCNFIMHKFESFLELSLQLTDALSLEETLYNYTTIEKISDYCCEKCGKKGDVNKQLKIHKAPNILILDLKKFDYANRSKKINKTLTFLEFIDLSPIMSNKNIDAKYDLYAVLVHYGSTLYSGHYVAFIKIDGCWVLADDRETQKLVNNSILLKQNPYMFFFQKRVVPKAQQKEKAQQNNNNKQKQQQKPKQQQQKQQQNDNLNKSQEIQPEVEIKRHTPSYSLYMNSDDDNLVSIVMKVHLPDLNIQNFIVTISSAGNITLDTVNKRGPYISTASPFAFNVTAATCTFFSKDQYLGITIPVLKLQMSHDSDTFSPEIKIDKMLDSNTLRMDDQLECGGEDEAIPLPKVAETPKWKLEILEMEKKNEVQENSLYRNLHSEILKSWADTDSNVISMQMAKLQLQQQQQQQQKLTEAKTSKKEKIRYMDKCICGGDKRYKDCHGKIDKTDKT